ncbi:MAG: copper chaperone CopZ [Actinomycetota bacterium]
MNTTITVSGMTCGHCVNSVTEELSKISGVKEVKVDLDSGKVDITSENELAQADLSEAIQEAGYEIK